MNKKRESKVPRWLRHRAILAAETVLLVGIVQELLEGWVLSIQVSNVVKVLFVMAATVGIIGMLLVVVQLLIERSLAGTHQMAKSLPLPMAVYVVHVAILIVLYYLYAYMWQLPVWPFEQW